MMATTSQRCVVLVLCCVCLISGVYGRPEGNINGKSNPLLNTPSCDTSGTDQAKILAAATTTLHNANFTTSSTGVMNFTDSWNAGSANPDGLYGLWSFPTYVAGTFPLALQDVAVWIGCTPPALQYWSFSHIVAQKQPGFHSVWADSGDSINLLEANSTHNGDHATNSTAALVLSADATSAATAVAALQSAGLPASAINTLVVPSAIVGRMGDEVTDDLMQVAMRVALFANADDGKAYTSSSWPVTLFSAAAGTTPNPFPTPALLDRTGPKSESQYLPALSDLMSNVTKRMELLGFQGVGTVTTMPTNHSDGRACLAANTFCAGATRDALYSDSGSAFSFESDDEDVLVVVGVNHAAVGTATYSNFATYTLGVGAATGSVASAQFNGSAAFFAPTLPSAPAFFAFAVARNCSHLKPYCLTLPVSSLPVGIPFSVVERVYLNPATKVGPDATQTVTARVMHFKGPNHTRLDDGSSLSR